MGGSAPQSPPTPLDTGGALSTRGFLSFQLLGPPSFVDFRGSGLTRSCKVGGVWSPTQAWRDAEERHREGGPLTPGP